jgi:hypothetical protein
MLNSRGGPKPSMLPGKCEDIAIEVNHRKKFGIYQLDTRGVLARRVEVPGWLSEAIQSGHAWSYPSEEIGESRGHIFLRPPRALFSGPAVGVDMEVFERLIHDSRIRLVTFFVYGTNHVLLDVWEISRSAFLLKAKRVQTKDSFMPQMMVEIASLESRSRGMDISHR